MNHLKKFNESYFEDLTDYTYAGGIPVQLKSRFPNVVNIGWLDNKNNFKKGDVPDGFLDRLKEIKPSLNHRGYHTCELCGKEKSSSVVHIKGKDGKEYVTPAMIYHYVKDHNYQPPQEFIDAVMAY